MAKKRPSRKTPKKGAKRGARKASTDKPQPKYKTAKKPHKSAKSKKPRKSAKPKKGASKSPRRTTKASKGIKRSRGVRATAEQKRARRALLSYVNRLGKRKAARRLDATVSEIERWLRTWNIPAPVRPEVIGLDTSGGGFTYLRGTSLQDAVKRMGYTGVSRLTGLSGKRIKEILSKRPKARIKVSRKRIQELGEKKGWDYLAEKLKATPYLIKSSSAFPKTDATKRLQGFTNQYGEGEVAYFLGIQPHTLKRWLDSNVPRSWEADLNRYIGRRRDEGMTVDEIQARLADPRSIKSYVTEALKKAAAWNKKVRGKFRISKKTAERWGRLREFDDQFKRLKEAWQEAQKAEKKKRPPKGAPPPVPAPPPTPPPLFPTKPPPLAETPQVPVPPIEQAVHEAMKDFYGKRASAIADSKNAGYLPLDDFGFFSPYKGTWREGYRYYGEVGQFVVLIDMTKLGNEIIKRARQMWAKIHGRGERMSIKYTFSAQGSGNPFYPGAFEPDKNEFNFFTLKPDDITEPHTIDRNVRTAMEQIWENAQENMLFFEHYEIVKSINIRMDL